MTVRVADATLNAYQPAMGQARNRFTVSPTARGRKAPPPAPRIRPAANGVTVDAPEPLANLLVRVPDGVRLIVDSQRGDVNVTDITGDAQVTAQRGNVTIMLPGYAQASSGRGNVSVTMGSTTWHGTLHFSSQRGDVQVSLPDKTAFTVHLHTDDGTLFTDFDLRGTSQGNAETIDGSVNGGGPRRIDVEAHYGSIRLLRLHPQA